MYTMRFLPGQRVRVISNNGPFADADYVMGYIGTVKQFSPTDDRYYITDFDTTHCDWWVSGCDLELVEPLFSLGIEEMLI